MQTTGSNLPFGEFAGKTAIVTGGAGGIGLATVGLLADAGAAVAIFDLDDAAMDGALEALRRPDGGSARIAATHVDVADWEAVERACAGVEQSFGGIDFLVNVAGGRGRTRAATIERMSADDWSHVIGLNLDGPFNCIKACIGPMRRRGGGAVVSVASLASVTMSMNNGASYTAAKSGVLGLTRHAAFELARDGIRVNAVLPGPVLSPQMKAKLSDEMLESVPRSLPLGRWIQPAEIAQAIAFFLSSMSSGCTGAHVIVDGGLHIGSPTSAEVYFRNRGEAPRFFPEKDP